MVVWRAKVFYLCGLWMWGSHAEVPKLNSSAKKKVTVEVNVLPHGDGGASDLNGPLHGFKDG